MKKITLYIATIFIIHLVNASQLNLNLSQYGNYSIILNGISYSIQDNSINFSKLASGNHHLKVVKHIRRNCNVSFDKVICNSTINVPYRSSVYASLYSPYQLNVTNIVYHQQATTTQHYCANSCRHHHRHNYRKRYNNGHNHNGHYKKNNNGHNHNGHYKKNNNGHNNQNYKKKNHHNGNNQNHNNGNYNNKKKNNNNGGNGNQNNGNHQNQNNGGNKKKNRNGNNTRRS